MELSVIIPTHNPDAGRLRRTLAGLRTQTLPADKWETLLVDNASSPALEAGTLAETAPPNLRIVGEPELGLTSARRRGFTETRAPLCVLVDDDNVLAPDYLANVIQIFALRPEIGVAGGRSLPEFEQEPPAWACEFLPLLALRDLGSHEIVSNGLRPDRAQHNHYPAYAPLGAGMALRHAAWTAWLDALATRTYALSDRRGSELTSSGDNDIVLCAMRAGWEAGYFPCLMLTHLIPASRLDHGYLARLNRGIQKSWMQVLALHEASPWPSLSPFGATLRKLKTWLAYRAWSSPAARIRWQGACGHFDGRIHSHQ